MGSDEVLMERSPRSVSDIAVRSYGSRRLRKAFLKAAPPHRAFVTAYLPVAPV